MALGAARNDVVGLVTRQGLRLAAIGLALGAPIAYAIVRAIQSMVFSGDDAVDPTRIVGVTATLVAVAFFATFLPALPSFTRSTRCERCKRNRVFMTSSIETAKRSELPRILELLEEADLPVAGVEHAESFLVAREQVEQVEQAEQAERAERPNGPNRPNRDASWVASVSRSMVMWDFYALSSFAQTPGEAVWESCSSSGSSNRRVREV